MTQSLHRPELLLRHAAQPIDHSTPPEQAAACLLKGESLIVTDHYRTGVEILSQLESLLKKPDDNATYELRQDFQRNFRTASMRLLAPIIGHALALRNAGEIGFLKELYRETPDFFLPFVQVQELHGAWNRFREGVHMAVLGHRLHPFYGTYAPTRVSHLELFGTWLSQYQGQRRRAVDVGTGCGVLALMLCKAGFDEVLATDNNPNAIESVVRDTRKLKSAPPITALHCDLLGDGTALEDLIVFNPPWTMGSNDSLLDRALLFQEGFFERFFEQACQRLSPKGRIVMLFSNVIQLVQPDVPHPILTELEQGRLRLVQKLQRKVKPPRGTDGRRRRTKERVEVWELTKL